MKKIFLALLISACFCLMACTKTTITLSGQERVEVGQTIELTATANVSDAITWTSSDSSVATVAGGVVTGVSVGEVTITATVKGVSATKAITVFQAVPTSITLSQTTVQLEVEEAVIITSNVLPSGADQTVTWESSNSAVATVSNGTITAVAVGSATITCKAINDVTATVTVTVEAKPFAVPTAEELKTLFAEALASLEEATNVTAFAGVMNTKGEVISSFAESLEYKLNGNVVSELSWQQVTDETKVESVYIRDGRAYLQNGSGEDAVYGYQQLTDNDHLTFIRNYNIANLINEYLPFLEEDAFFTALAGGVLVPEAGEPGLNAVTYLLTLNNYTGSALNVTGQATVVLSVGFIDGQVCAIALTMTGEILEGSTAADISTKEVVVTFFLDSEDAIEFPDLTDYPRL